MCAFAQLPACIIFCHGVCYVRKKYPVACQYVFLPAAAMPSEIIPSCRCIGCRTPTMMQKAAGRTSAMRSSQPATSVLISCALDWLDSFVMLAEQRHSRTVTPVAALVRCALQLFAVMRDWHESHYSVHAAAVDVWM